jgi:hypothetical protein
MANELQKLLNPDDVPGAVSSGYQRQNTNLFCLQTGLDTTEPFDNGAGVIAIPAGGIVEVNGSMFKITSGILLNKPNQSVCYWVAISDNGDGTANTELVTRPGVWSPTKCGCYLSDGRRTLNWVSLGSPTGTLPSATYSKTISGEFAISLSKGWYYAELQSGLGGGNGGNGGDSSYNGGAGGAGASPTTTSNANYVFFHDRKNIIKGKVGASGGRGGDGGKGCARGSTSQTGGAGGGGGGSGSGEKTEIYGLVSTRNAGHGKGGNGGYPTGGGGGGGGLGSSMGTDGAFTGGNGNGTKGGAYGGGNGGSVASGNGIGGGGGGLCIAGVELPAGSSGGNCRIYALGN